MTACENENQDIVFTLIQAGAYTGLNLVDNFGNTALMLGLYTVKWCIALLN